MVDFRYFLNRQGARGIKGETGNEGFSPAITVETDTINEYTLRIITKSDNFVTPNLKMSINNTGGSYLRFNQETGEVSAAFLDNATETELGGIVIASQEDVNAGEDTAKAVTPRTLYEYINPIIADAAKLSQTNDFTGINRFNNIVRLDSAENNFVGKNSKIIKEIDDGSEFLKEYTYLHQGSIEAGDNIAIEQTTEGIKISSTGGSGTSGTQLSKDGTQYTSLTLGKGFDITGSVLDVNLDEIGNELNALTSRVTNLETQVGNIATSLDNINGEVI